MDRDSRLSQCCRADYVSIIFAGTGLINVPARTARRHGAGCHRVGRARYVGWSSAGAVVLGPCADGRTRDSAPSTARVAWIIIHAELSAAVTRAHGVYRVLDL